MTRRFGVEGNSIYVQAIVGLFLLAILGIIASFMTTIPFLAPPRTVLRVAGGIAQFVALISGTGAFILSRMGGGGSGEPPSRREGETAAR